MILKNLNQVLLQQIVSKIGVRRMSVPQKIESHIEQVFLSLPKDG
jgi:hypothetical protein